MLLFQYTKLCADPVKCGTLPCPHSLLYSAERMWFVTRLMSIEVSHFWCSLGGLECALAVPFCTLNPARAGRSLGLPPCFPTDIGAVGIRRVAGSVPLWMLGIALIGAAHMLAASAEAGQARVGVVELYYAVGAACEFVVPAARRARAS